MRATSALDCITNVTAGTRVDAQRGRQSERKRVRADAASLRAERPGTRKRFAHVLHARERIPPRSRQIGWRALSQALPAHDRLECNPYVFLITSPLVYDPLCFQAWFRSFEYCQSMARIIRISGSNNLHQLPPVCPEFVQEVLQIRLIASHAAVMKFVGLVFPFHHSAPRLTS